MERCKENALQYSYRTEWAKNSSAAYDSARRNGWLDDCCSHMERRQEPTGYWTVDRCVERAREFSSIADWQKGCPGSFDASRYNGSYNDCTAHMRKKRRRGSITIEGCREEALRHESRSAWKSASHATFAFAKANGLLDELTSHMEPCRFPNGYWTFERCAESAGSFETRNEWRWKDFKSYDAARRAGWIDKIAEASGMPRYDGSQAQRGLADRFRAFIADTGIELCEEVSGLAGHRTEVDMAFYRNGLPFLAVEYQGAYWHSEAAGKSRNYHRDRMNALREKGIRLITVHESEADNPVIDSMVRSALGLIEKKIRASKCEVVPVSDGTSGAFYEYSHIQGGRISGKDRLNLGLECKGKLVACMTFVRANNRHTGSGQYDWCLHRFATLPNIRVMGAAGRLFKQFHSEHSGQSVISYCDLQYFDGRTYRSIGFEHIRDNPPDYRWVKAQTVLSKHEAQRKFLPDLLGAAFDPALSERENMERAGYSKIWDCGKAVYAFLP